MERKEARGKANELERWVAEAFAALDGGGALARRALGERRCAVADLVDRIAQEAGERRGR